MTDEILTINNVSIGTIHSCPNINLPEALYLIENSFTPDNKLYEAIYESHAIFRFPFKDSAAQPESLEELEKRIRQRKLSIIKDGTGFRAINHKDPVSYNCSICKTKGILTIAGVRFTGFYTETVIECGRCSKQSTLNIPQAVALRNNLYAYAMKQDEKTKALIKKNALEYIYPDHKYGEEWLEKEIPS